MVQTVCNCIIKFIISVQTDIQSRTSSSFSETCPCVLFGWLCPHTWASTTTVSYSCPRVPNPAVCHSRGDTACLKQLKYPGDQSINCWQRIVTGFYAKINVILPFLVVQSSFFQQNNMFILTTSISHCFNQWQVALHFFFLGISLPTAVQ
jgi:hypothetical protein